jgi:hypothetical protein
LENTMTKVIAEIVDGRDLEQYSVRKRDDGTYEVWEGGTLRHSPCSAEDAIRALSHYMQSLVFENDRLKGYEDF